jgi:hypothetical protein
MLMEPAREGVELVGGQTEPDLLGADDILRISSHPGDGRKRRIGLEKDFDWSNYVQCHSRTDSDNLAFGKTVVHGIEEYTERCASAKRVDFIHGTVVDVGEVEAVVLDVVEKSSWSSDCCGRPLAQRSDVGIDRVTADKSDTGVTVKCQKQIQKLANLLSSLVDWADDEYAGLAG